MSHHESDCDPGYTCVECGGCDCGAVESICTGPGCYSREAYEQWCDEAGMAYEERSYG